mmetsp:Transcript_1015/g.3166  ORF Transcript_1015/g.3166 Transcript_1015/m.3166 type:complete len:138 (+) Transcript_1015:68-481(+)
MARERGDSSDETPLETTQESVDMQRQQEMGGTMTATITEAPVPRPREILEIRLRCRPTHRVMWTADTHDNEHEGKKSSKKCCIFHKKRAFDESSSDGESDSGDSDGDSSSSGGGPPRLDDVPDVESDDENDDHDASN